MVCPEFSPGDKKALALSSAGTALFATPTGHFIIASAFTGNELAVFGPGSQMGALLQRVTSFAQGHFLFSESWIVFKVPGDGLYCYAVPQLTPWAGAPERIFNHTNARLYWAFQSAGKTFTVVMPSGIAAISFAYYAGQKSAWLNATPVRLPGAPPNLTDVFFEQWQSRIAELNFEISINEALSCGGQFDAGHCHESLHQCVEQNLAAVKQAMGSTNTEERCHAVICGPYTFVATQVNRATQIRIEHFPPPAAGSAFICSAMFNAHIDQSSLLVSHFGRHTHSKFIATGQCGLSNACVIIYIDVEARIIRSWGTQFALAPEKLFLNWRGDVQSEKFCISKK